MAIRIRVYPQYGMRGGLYGGLGMGGLGMGGYGMYGYGVQMKSPLPNLTPSYLGTYSPYKHDMAKAKALMKEAGVKTPKSVKRLRKSALQFYARRSFQPPQPE